MKANEFVKKFGIKSAKYWIDHFNSMNTLPDEFINIEFLGNLKRIVESHELVENHNGVDMAKRFIDANIECNDSDRLKQAIADVESCMEGVS